MSDAAHKDGGGSAQVAEIVIRYDQVTGKVAVKGPIDQEMLFLGMLEMARLAVIEKRRAGKGAELPRIVVPAPRLPS